MTARVIPLLVSLTALLLVVLRPELAAASGASSSGQVSLQRMIDQAESGAVLELPSGIYEGPVRIDKPITLTPEEGGVVTIIGRGHESAVSIEAEHVHLVGLHIEDRTMKEAPTVHVFGDGARLEQLHIVTGADGVKIEEADDVSVLDSVIEWGAGDAVRFSDRGNGIDLFRTNEAQISGNVIRQAYDGIYVEFSYDTLVDHNVIEESRYGIHVMYSERTAVRSNAGTLNITGAMIMTSSGTEVSSNTFTKQSENVNSQGILLFDVQDAVVVSNTVEGNRVGFHVEHSHNNRIEENRIESNFIGIQLLDSSHNTITGNALTGNVTDALARGNTDNDLEANYWDSFAGIDADGDGFSDTSYVIHPFFQELIKKRPPFQLFFRTPGIIFLESLYEGERSTWTTDRSPLMAPPPALQPQEAQSASAITALTGALFVVVSLGMVMMFRRRSV